MRIRKSLQWFMIIALLGASAAALHAQTYNVFITGGGSSIFDKQYYSVYGAAYGSTYKTGASFAVGAEIPITKILSAEGSYGFTRNNLAVTNFYNTAVPNNRIEYPIQDQRVSADAVAHSATFLKGVMPYVVAGVEFDRFEPTSTGAAMAKSSGFNGVPNAVLSPDNKFGFNFGFGLDIKLARMLAFRIDARDHITGTPTFGLPASVSSGSTTAYYPVKGRASDVVYSAGFVFRFGT